MSLTNFFIHELSLKSLGEQHKSDLEKNFSEDEVWAAVCFLVRDKTSDPDGFPMLVYQKAWGFMKENIMAVVWELQDKSFLDWGLIQRLLLLFWNLME